MIVTRFAPSPTGLLHLGHAHAALFAWNEAQQAKGRFLLRIEDIDPVRCKEEFVQDIFDDLHWLGPMWEEPSRRQSEHIADYQASLAHLRDRGLIYPCFCTRREIEEEAAAAGHAPHMSIKGPDGPVYPGTCKNMPETERQEKTNIRGAPVWRVDMAKACAASGPLKWQDRSKGEIAAHPEAFGDVVLARKDVPTSYHLSVTVDDHLQGVTLVTRGEDLFRATDVHVLLQKLLGYETPEYHHHKLLVDENGKRFAKRDRAMTLKSLREQGKSPEEVRRMAGF